MSWSWPWSQPSEEVKVQHNYKIINNSHEFICFAKNDFARPYSNPIYMKQFQDTEHQSYLSIEKHSISFQKFSNPLSDVDKMKFGGVIVTIEKQCSENHMTMDWKIVIESDPLYCIRVQYANDIDLHLVAVSTQKTYKEVTKTMTDISYFLTPNNKVIRYTDSAIGTTEDGYRYSIERLSFNEVVLHVSKA